MSKVGVQTLTAEPLESGEFAWQKPASEEAVSAILGANPELVDGFTRSEFLWIRLVNGDLILGVYPQDEAYFAFEGEHS